MRAWVTMAGVAVLTLTACSREDGDAPNADTTATNIATGVPVASEPEAAPANGIAARQVAKVAPSFFVGTWTGPEGLSFVVEQQAEGYRIRNRDTLDTEQTFAATRDGGMLRFVRRGEALTARPGTGAETGFKWLANKRDCLIVQAGVEGYCRD